MVIIQVIIKNNNYKLELLENCEIKTKQELLERERYFIENSECVNKEIPGRTKNESQKEYYNTNKDKILTHQKEYYNVNKDNLKKQQNSNFVPRS